MKDIKESLNAVSRPKTLFGGQDSAEKSRIWCNNAEFALFKHFKLGKTVNSYGTKLSKKHNNCSLQNCLKNSL